MIESCPVLEKLRNIGGTPSLLLRLLYSLGITRCKVVIENN